MHRTTGRRDPAASFPLPHPTDDRADRRAANAAVLFSAIGLAITGAVEIAVALLSGSVGLLGDALHNLSDVSTSIAVFAGFRASRRTPTAARPYGFDRAEDLAGIGIAAAIWASAAFAGIASVRKLAGHGTTSHLGLGMAAAAVGIVGNRVVAAYKMRIGRQINSATLVADARHSWLDALSSAGALIGLAAVAAGQRWGDPVAGLAVTGFICHVGWEVTTDVLGRLMDGIEPEILQTAESAAAAVPGVLHAHARARRTGRVLRVELEGWVDRELTVAQADRIGVAVAEQVAVALPETGAFTWTARGI